MTRWLAAGPADPRRVPEKVIQQHVKQALRLLGYQIYDTSQPFRAAITPGVADLIAFAPAKPILFVEVKSARGTLTPAQAVFAQHVQASLGGRYVVARSAADVFEQLGETPCT